MKQHITQKQWNELTFAQQKAFISIFLDAWRMSENEIFDTDIYTLITIGQMIELLGDDFDFINNEIDAHMGWYVGLHNDEGFEGYDNLCDTLWEAVKYKLNEKDKSTTDKNNAGGVEATS